jgi:hypothetical protein
VKKASRDRLAAITPGINDQIPLVVRVEVYELGKVAKAVEGFEENPELEAGRVVWHAWDAFFVGHLEAQEPEECPWYRQRFGGRHLEEWAEGGDCRHWEEFLLGLEKAS